MIMEEAEQKVVKDEFLGEKEIGCRCGELEERSRKAEARCVELELEIRERESEFKVLEHKLKAVEAEKLAIESELKRLNLSKEYVVDLTEDEKGEDPLVQLAIETSALEHKKKGAEAEAEAWKDRFEKLRVVIWKLHEFGVLREAECILDEDTKPGFSLAGIEVPIASGRKDTYVAMRPEDGPTSKGSDRRQIADLPYNVTPDRDASFFVGQRRGICVNQVRKQLVFEDDKISGKNRALSVQGGARSSATVINICDSDEEQGNANASILTEHASNPTVGIERQMGSDNGLKEIIPAESLEDYDANAREDNPVFPSAPRRKRVITSDSEGGDEDDDNDDNIPICKLIKRWHPEKQTPNQVMLELGIVQGVGTPTRYKSVIESPHRRRLLSLRKREQKDEEEKRGSSKTQNTEECLRGISTIDDVQDEELEDDMSNSEEDDSSNSFIDDTFSDPQDESHVMMELNEITSRLQGNCNRRSKWEYETDMLADFGKDAELCMRALCALYRMQTSDEKELKSTHHYNGSGFSKLDALRGTNLGEFLTDGDPQGDLKKSAEELRRYDPEAVEICRTLATRYSRQLFKTYKNREDPYFLPS